MFFLKKTEIFDLIKILIISDKRNTIESHSTRTALDFNSLHTLNKENKELDKI